MLPKPEAADILLTHTFSSCSVARHRAMVMQNATSWACPVQYFYEEQLHRMELMSQEPVLFEDVMCQMHDMLQPAAEGVFTLRDLKRNRHLAGTLFNILFNLNKFVAFETRDPFVVRQVCPQLRALHVDACSSLHLQNAMGTGEGLGLTVALRLYHASQICTSVAALAGNAKRRRLMRSILMLCLSVQHNRAVLGSAAVQSF